MLKGDFPTGCTVLCTWVCIWESVLVLYVSQRRALSGPATRNWCLNNAGKQAELAINSRISSPQTESVCLLQGLMAGGCYCGLPVDAFVAKLGLNGSYWLQVMSPFQTKPPKEKMISEATVLLTIYALVLIFRIFLFYAYNAVSNSFCPSTFFKKNKSKVFSMNTSADLDNHSTDC